MSDTVKPGRQWATERGDRILDPDGWRHDDGVDFDTPITLADYLRRYGECTVWLGR